MRLGRVDSPILLFTLESSIVIGAPVFRLRFPASCQPPSVPFTHPCALASQRLPRPNGSGYENTADTMWPRSQSDRPRSSPRLRASSAPENPPVEPPENCDCSSIDLL